jgi:predicted 2-oxoglutarate/Fe(II)-dependent dioxygenase YbiX
MNKDLMSYVKVYDDWIDSDKCKQTIKELESANWHQHTFYNAQDGSYTAQSGNRELDVSWQQNISTKPYIMQRIWDSYQKYTSELNFTWFNSWQGYSDVRFNRYNEDRLMALHCDHIHSLFDGERKGIPTLTFLAILNDGYEGGEFIMFGDEEIKFKEGSAVVFPSCFLYPHTVKPVTKGVRYSCVSWAW